MALREDREIYRDNIRYTCDNVAEAGDTLVVKTTGSGVILGTSAGVASLLANPSGYKVHGMLTHDVVDVDETLYHRNDYKGVMKINERCRVVKEGILVTNSLKSGDTPTDGETAYLTLNGELTKTMSATGGLVATPKVGVFRGGVDADAYIAVELNLPVV